MSDIQILQTRLQEARELYSKVRASVVGISERAKSGEYTKEQLCDLGFLCRELVLQFEEIRKDIGATKVLVDKLMCIKTMSEMLTKQSGDDMVRGELSSGKPIYKKTVTMPRKDTAEYQEMCEYFGIDAKGVEMGVAKLSWKQVSKYVTELTEMGRQIPSFIPKVHDDYTVTHRRKN